ncbi:MAG: transcriptional regulator [Chlorobiaceae bacterium]|jgi:hypothetical protein|nr:transcriptional regulator [Chlorobiaceae bacterium]
MEAEKQQFEIFVKKVAGYPVSWGKPVTAALPQLLKQRYALYTLHIENRPFLGIYLKEKKDFKPAAFEKHLRQIWKTLTDYDGYCVITQGLPGYVRQRMVERKIPFVDIGLHLFWPELGAAYQQKKLKGILHAPEQLSPATQAVLMYALNGGMPEPVTPKKLAEQLGYTAMTMTRALDEIESARLCTVKREGKERLLFAKNKKALWKHARPFLQNPVRSVKRIMEQELPQSLRLTAGETALAQCSMLTFPTEPVYALWSRHWKKIAGIAQTIPIEDEGTCLLQLWHYDPALFAVAGRVDPFSLYLSMQKESDERVESALEEMMEKLEW